MGTKGRNCRLIKIGPRFESGNDEFASISLVLRAIVAKSNLQRRTGAEIAAQVERSGFFE
jgi:hypothetical protein